MICAISGYYLKPDTSLAKLVIFWKERFEFIFIASMAILTLIIFRPFQNNNIYITPHEQLLFFMYGNIILISADWNLFITQSTILKKLRSVISLNK